MNPNNDTPSIRFAGFTDAWEQRKLGELCEVFRSGEFIKASDIYEDGAFPVYGGNGLRGYADRFNYDGNYALIGRQGALCGNMNFSSGKAYFTEHAVAVHANDNNNTRFLFYLLDTMNLGQYSAQSAQPGLAVNKLITLPALCPSKLEQETIAEFLTRIDDLITLHQRKYDQLVNIKKSMLEKMFPKNGELVPEVRFAGFTDAWEQRKLGEVCGSLEYGLNAAAKEYDGENKYIRITDIDDNTRLFLTSDLTSPDMNLKDAARYRLEAGDIVFARTGASVGKSYIYKRSDGTVYYAGFLIRAKVKQEYSADFVFQNTLSQNYEKYILITSQRSGQPGVNAQEYAEYTFSVPEYEEQKKIGTFLTNLDGLITLHQRKLERLQNIKKACLEKMFV